VNNISLLTRAQSEISTYLPLPPARSREFWTRWKIEHIRQLSHTGHAAEELFAPQSERTLRVLDKLSIRQGNHSTGTVDTSVAFASDSKLRLSSPLYLGDMSFGALSGVPNIAIAKAADLTGVMAGTGEGGLLNEVADCSRVTVQWASARFGVDISTLTKGQGVVVKIGQGAKPGIGGHLPGVKVTQPISETRRIPAGKDAISPAPHHDIYSIEDLGQRILALKEATRKPVFVKVGATNYIPYIASGVARMGASGIIIDGSGAGTGAAPSVVKNNVGIPIELAVASVDSILRKEGLREGFTIIAAGRVSTPEDSVKLVALGANITSLGTAALLALGCLMVHKCHLGYCPAVLTNKISPNQVKVLSLKQSVNWLVNLVNGWTEEMKLILKLAGVTSFEDLVGRRDLLEVTSPMNYETMSILGLDKITAPSNSAEVNLFPTNDQDQTKIWTSSRVAMLREMAGTIGKAPGEAEISSMGTTSPPFVEEPVRISDWLVSDGAQVTRPSIDPYREEIEISTHLDYSGIRLSSPFYFSGFAENLPANVIEVFVRAAASMGLIAEVKSEASGKIAKYSDRILSHISYIGKEKLQFATFKEVSSNAMTKMIKKKKQEGSSLFLKCPSSEKIFSKVSRLSQLQYFSGIILDEDENGSDTPLECMISRADRQLKESGKRSRFNLMAQGNSIRGSDDIFKLLALGADCVGIGKAALIAIGYEEGDLEIVFDAQKSIERIENFVLATQKDLKLLAGAAGVSSVSSTLVGNRELLRSVDLNPEIRKKLGVKPAGEY
jgi:glutamate synthase domain-containing protein 2